MLDTAIELSQNLLPELLSVTLIPAEDAYAPSISDLREKHVNYLKATGNFSRVLEEVVKMMIALSRLATEKIKQRMTLYADALKEVRVALVSAF